MGCSRKAAEHNKILIDENMSTSNPILLDYILTGEEKSGVVVRLCVREGGLVKEAGREGKIQKKRE